MVLQELEERERERAIVSQASEVRRATVSQALEVRMVGGVSWCYRH